MENRINVAELLKDCPKGMELDCVLFDDVKFEECAGDSIYIYLNNGGVFALTKYGNCIEFPISKCVIFPKGKTTWEGFEPCKFKDGDILFVDCADEEAEKWNQYIFILNKPEFYDKWHSYCFLDGVGTFHSTEVYLTDDNYHPRFATEEEKQKLLQAIKDNGYKWDTENKTLEKLVTEKFDINTLVPFESRVLVRDSKYETWRPAVWGFCDESMGGYPFEVVGGQGYTFCIPYEGNEYLLGTTEDCEDRYKLWLS